MTQQTHNHGTGRSRLVEEIEKVMRERLGWNEIVMSNVMWRYIGVNVDELIAYGINPHEWIEILHRLTVNDPYMLGAVHGDVYVRPTSPSWYEVSMDTTSSAGVLYFERLMRRIKMPSVEFSWRERRSAKFTTEEPKMVNVRFYVLLRKSEWPWYGKGYETISSFNTRELLSYLAGLIDTDGTITVTVAVSSRRRRFTIEINSANIEFLKYLRDVIYERLGIISYVTTDKRLESGGKLRFQDSWAVQLYEGLRQYLAHSVKRLKAELYYLKYNKELATKEFDRFYEPLKYDNNGNDVKRCRAADTLTQAAPQTHTHGGLKILNSNRET
jgi:hypothetical protein